MKFLIIIFADFDKETADVRRVKLFAKALSLRGHEVKFLIPQRFGAGPLQAEVDGFRIYWAAPFFGKVRNSLKGRVLARWRTLRRLWGLCGKGLNWIVLYNLGLEGLLFYFVARLRGISVAAEYCDVRALPSKRSLEDRLRAIWHTVADATIPRVVKLNLVISEYLSAWIRARAPQTRVAIIPPLFDSERFQFCERRRTHFREQWGISTQTIVISYLGGFWDVDGVSILIQAASQLHKAGEDFCLVLSGQKLAGRDCDDVPSLVHDLGLSTMVICTGWLKTDEVIAAMSAADILVVPKIECVINRAGLPTKIAEYLAMGRAVVASKVGDLPRYLSDGVDLLFVQPGEPDALATALRTLLHNSALRQQLGRNGRASALRHFDYRAVAERLESAFARA